MSNPKKKSSDAVSETNGKLPPWLAKKKEKEMEEAKKEDEDMEEAADCSCDPDDDLPWCDDCEEQKEAKKEDEDMEESSNEDDEDDDDDDDEEEMEEESYEDKKKKMKEHLAPLFAGQKLSENFKTKAETIFGAVIAERETAIREHYETELAKAIASTETDLAEKVDDYLSYVVEEWYKENKIALERSLRAEIAENFMEGLRNLFTDNFMTIPDDKVDVLEAANSKIDELTEQVNAEIKSNLDKSKAIAALEAKIAFAESVDGLTLSEVEKLKSLAESVEYDTVDEYKSKLNVLKETYLKTPVKESRETLIEDVNAAKEAAMSPSMAAYARTLSKFRN